MKSTGQRPEAPESLTLVQKQLEHLLSTRQSLVLATHDVHGECELGTAPFVWDDGLFALLLSGLAPHTRHIEAGSSLKIMLLEDEVHARQAFARQRLVLNCSASRLERESEQSDKLFGLFAQRFGSIVPLLRGLGDFHVYVFKPQGGRFVAGFGKAYRLEGLQVLEHLRG